MQYHSEPPMARAMFILGQIGAIICHERGPRPQTAVLNKMASQPAEGFVIALARMTELCPPRRGPRRALLLWKQKEIQRLSRLMPGPLPAAASAQAQMPFWAGYCQYWEEMLKEHAQRDSDPIVVHLDDVRRKRANA